MSEKQRVNLGCGQYPKAGWTNVDADPAAKADVWHDLNVAPYPFHDNSVSEIHASHVLEHLTDPIASMRELARILEPGGRMTIRVPHFSRGFTHPDHKRGFDVSFPLYFDPSFSGGYCGFALDCVSTRLRWFAQPELKKAELGAAAYFIGSALGMWFDFWAKLSPYAASRIWCFLAGGFEEVEFVFQKPIR